MEDFECRDRLILLAGELSTAAELGLWIYEGRELKYTSSAHEEEFGKLFALSGGWEFMAEHEGTCRTPVYFSDNQGLVWIGERVFSKTREEPAMEEGSDRNGVAAAERDEAKALVLIGPMFISSVSEQSVEERLRSLDLSLRVRRQMVQAFRDVPVVVYTMLEQLHTCSIT